MIIDFSAPISGGDFMAYSEMVFESEPKQPNQIIETILLGGSNTGGGVSLTGTADTREN